MTTARCGPSHDLDPIVATIVVRLELCSDTNPLEALRGLPDRLSEALEPLELHEGHMTFDVGSVVATGDTHASGNNNWGWITRTELVLKDEAF